MKCETVEGLLIGTILILAVLVVRLADQSRHYREALALMRSSRDGWRDHHRTLVDTSDDGTSFWDYWRTEARKDR